MLQAILSSPAAQDSYERISPKPGKSDSGFSSSQQPSLYIFEQKTERVKNFLPTKVIYLVTSLL
jgi:hypothetical protein